MSEANNEPLVTDYPAGADPGSVAGKPRSRFMWTIIILVLLVGGGLWGQRIHHSVTTHTSTDDAYLTSDITQIAPQVTGTITRVLVHDNDLVKPGQLLVALDEATYQTAVAQARANLQAAMAQAQGAAVNVALTSETGSAQVQQAQGGVEQASGGVGGAQAQVSASQATITKSTASTSEARSAIVTAQAGVEAARANRRQAQAAMDAVATQIANAQAAVRAAETGVKAATTNAATAAGDVKRYEALVAQSAISRQVFDHAVAASEVAQAQVENARQQVEMARQGVAGRTADLEAARQRLSAADAAVAATQAQVGTAEEHARAAAEDITSAHAARLVAQQGVRQAQARRVQAVGQLRQAQTTPRQVALSASNAAQAQAKISQAQATLDEALIKLSHCRIYAPRGGQVSKKTATVGALVQPGTPLMAVVTNEGLWVVANFKETQLVKVVPGQEAEIEVDALRGATFRGRVDSVAAATGATFALLPPENASGNFTKIVQRIPVKILLEPGQRGLERLRGGMSVKAIIDVASVPVRSGS